MKICFICQNLFTLGGVQRVVTTILNELSKEENMELYVIMPCHQEENKLFSLSEKIEIINSNSLNKKISYLSKLILAVNKRFQFLNNYLLKNIADKLIIHPMTKENYINKINDLKVDAVIATGDYGSLLLASISERLNCKTIGWQHSTFDGYFKSRGHSSYGLSLVYKKYLNKLDKVIVLTKADKNCYDSYFDIDSVVLHNPINLKFSNVSNLNNKNILFVGRFNIKVKGIDYLIKIMRKVFEKDKEIKLIMVGDGDDKYKIENLIKRNGLENNIILEGTTTDIEKYYLNSDVTVSTSRWEGFGMVIVESMACGVPVVCFDNYGPNEIISDGENGYLISKFNIDEFANKLIKLMNCYKEREKMGKAARRRARDFYLNEILEQLKFIIIQ